MGRPKKGALSTYPKKLLDRIYYLRDQHEGWGANTILVELQEEFGYTLGELPGVNSVNRYLKQEGFIHQREPKGEMPLEKCPSSIKDYHELWEMDAEGTVAVEGLNYVSNINIKDAKSKVHIMAFPVHTKGKMKQPKTESYYWTLRLAFAQWGLPKSIQADKDSVFIDSRSKSPFPSKLHLWLIGLGIKFCFINVPPPLKQAMVERSHQTLNRQTLKGQKYENWQALFKFTNKRRKRLNEKLPNRMIGNKAPLQVHPDAQHSGRIYQVQQEAELFEIHRIYEYLAQCCWYRKVSKAKTVSLSRQIYYLNIAKAETQVQITFCPKSKNLIFRDDKELIGGQLPIKNCSIFDIMGGTTEDLISMKKTLFHVNDFPL